MDRGSVIVMRGPGRWFAEAPAEGCGMIGSRAAHLSRLAGWVRTPPGFYVRPLRRAGGGAPEVPAATLRRMYDRLGDRCGRPDVPVAVSVSAVRPGRRRAYTFLNVQGEEALHTAVTECAAALPGPEAGGVVMVQRLVPAKWTALLHPVGEFAAGDGAVEVRACWGLGEDLTGGNGRADSYLVRCRDSAVLERSVADKREMTVAAGGGTVRVEVPAARRTRACLDDRQLRRVTRLTVAVNRQLGQPVALTVCRSEGRLHVLVCRSLDERGTGVGSNAIHRDRTRREGEEQP